ncbi:MAG: hypothetical protein E6572_13510 [Enterococcus faecalis]|uniref:hypothetical protein n=1 Tax=Enterococcus faecalis TaxID=1351 RepID=UPI000667B705|nr:hypothetical protein [Enterococcus faecalis]MDU6310818.1 hypothetical protein [Enterococcus faecalis]
MKNEYRSIKETADYLGISRQSVYSKLSKMTDNERLKFTKNGQGDKMLLNSDGVEFIRNKTQKKTVKKMSIDSKSLQEHLQPFYVEQMQLKDQQIENLQSSLKESHKLLDQQQQLSLQAQQRVEQLEKQLALEPPKDQEQTKQELESWQIAEYETKIKSLESNLEETKEDLQERDKVMRYLKQEYDIDSLDDLVEFAEGENTRKWWQFWRR